ncbi:MAG: hypothetical protein GY925_20870 [Actinomycetia bacterium]|nr:hypothetical protein [Actinomycetes bacterium]
MNYSDGTSSRLAVGLVLPCLLLAVGCGRADDPQVADGVDVSAAPETAMPDGRRFVLPETESLTLIDAQVAEPQDNTQGHIVKRFAQAGSPHDDGEGERVSIAVWDATGIPTDDVVANGVEVKVDNRSFLWVPESEDQRMYLGPTPLGSMIVMATLNLDEATAVHLLAAAELSGTDVLFDGQPTPDGWIDTGTFTTLTQFFAGATGSSSPPEGNRALYAEKGASVPARTWDDPDGGIGLTLASWPVTGTDPDNEARYNLDGEVEVEVLRDDGSTTIGFSSPADSEFFEFVVWQDGAVWLALSRPASGSAAGLIDLAATIREANADEVEHLDSLAAG